ncbi:MAG: type II toxin-antitoxin system HicB family antitoxin [Ruminococcus sp.]|nr:type II toxin-antitoxin system HicB family antitoxin [Ruminococcus sp.]
MYPDKYHYIAVLECTGEGVGIYFPDLPGCTSCAKNTDEAVVKAREALSLHLYGMEEDGEAIPAPTGIDGLKLKKNELPLLTSVYMKSFREKMHSRYVKKTLSIPNWLNSAAEEQGINFSAVLQTALKDRLNMRD